MSSDVLEKFNSTKEKGLVLANAEGGFSDEGFSLEFFAGNIKVNKPAKSKYREVYVDRVLLGYASFSDLQDYYEVHNLENIVRFIINIPNSYNTLIELGKELKNSFPSEQLKLEVFSDPDDQIADDLIILIQTKMTAENALNLLEEFEERFWEDRYSQIEEHLSIDFEFI